MDEPKVYPWPYEWEGTEEERLRLGASLTFRESLIWLEEAGAFAEQIKRTPWIKPYGFSKVPPTK